MDINNIIFMSPTNESNSFKLHQIDLSTIKSDKLGDVLTKMALNDLNCPCTLCQINAKISQVCTQATENAINQCKNSTDIKNTNVLNSTIDQSKDTENLDKIMLSKEESSDENVKGIKGTQVESTVNQNERYFPQCTDASVKCSTSVKVKVKKRNKAKSSPLKKVNKPKQMTRPRKEETPEERQKRLEKQRLKYRELREKETPEKRTKRLDKIRQYRKSKKESTK